MWHLEWDYCPPAAGDAHGRAPSASSGCAHGSVPSASGGAPELIEEVHDLRQEMHTEVSLLRQEVKESRLEALDELQQLTASINNLHITLAKVTRVAHGRASSVLGPIEEDRSGAFSQVDDRAEAFDESDTPSEPPIWPLDPSMAILLPGPPTELPPGAKPDRRLRWCV